MLHNLIMASLSTKGLLYPFLLDYGKILWQKVFSLSPKTVIEVWDCVATLRDFTFSVRLSMGAHFFMAKMGKEGQYGQREVGKSQFWR